MPRLVFAQCHCIDVYRIIGPMNFYTYRKSKLENEFKKFVMVEGKQVILREYNLIIHHFMIRGG